MYFNFFGVIFTGRFQKAIFAMQREVANEQAFDYIDEGTKRTKRDTAGLTSFDVYSKRRTLEERLDDMKKIIKIAVNRTSKDFARSIFAKSLYVFIKVGCTPCHFPVKMYD